MHESLRAQLLRARFAALRRDVPAINDKQADLPAGARPIANPRGSAPGVRVEIGTGVAYALPGVPHEISGWEEIFVAFGHLRNGDEEKGRDERHRLARL